MFAGIGVFDKNPLTETTAAIPVNALEFDAIVIALVGSVMEANKLQSWKALVTRDVTLEPKITFVILVALVLPWNFILLSGTVELTYV